MKVVKADYFGHVSDETWEDLDESDQSDLIHGRVIVDHAKPTFPAEHASFPNGFIQYPDGKIVPK